MRRSAGVTVVGVLVLLGSLITLAMGGLILRLAVSGGRGATQSLPRVAMAFASLIYILPAIWGICSGVGIFRLRNWARVSTVVFSCLLVLMSAAGASVMLFLPYPQSGPQAMTPNFWLNLRIGIGAFYGLLAAIGVWWLIYLQRESVKSQFRGEAGEQSESHRPLSITVIGWYLLLSVLFFPLVLLLRPPALVLGFLLTGKMAIAVYVAYSILYLCLGIGLLRLNRLSRLIAIAFCIFAVLNSACLLLPGYSDRMRAFLASQPHWYGHSDIDPHFLISIVWLGFVIGVLLAGTAIYFLVTRRAAFYGLTADTR